MHPIRKSNGYTPEGKKKYLRFFVIKKIKSVKNKKEEISENIVENVVELVDKCEKKKIVIPSSE